MSYKVRCYTDQHGTHIADVSSMYRLAEWSALSGERRFDIIKDMYGPTAIWPNFLTALQVIDDKEELKCLGIITEEIINQRQDQVNHPSHYGGEDNPYEAIKIIEAHDLGFHLGNVVKYVLRAGKKGEMLQDLEKALWYLNRKIEKVKNE